MRPEDNLKLEVMKTSACLENSLRENLHFDIKCKQIHIVGLDAHTLSEV